MTSSAKSSPLNNPLDGDSGLGAPRGSNTISVGYQRSAALEPDTGLPHCL